MSKANVRGIHKPKMVQLLSYSIVHSAPMNDVTTTALIATVWVLHQSKFSASALLIAAGNVVANCCVGSGMLPTVTVGEPPIAAGELACDDELEARTENRGDTALTTPCVEFMKITK